MSKLLLGKASPAKGGAVPSNKDSDDITLPGFASDSERNSVPVNGHGIPFAKALADDVDGTESPDSVRSSSRLTQSLETAEPVRSVSDDSHALRLTLGRFNFNWVQHV